MEINIINETTYKIDQKQQEILQKIADKTIAILNIEQPYIVSVILQTPSEIHTINKQYRGIDRPTDVISFALFDEVNEYQNDEADVELGDIFINVEAIKQQAKEYGHSEYREFGFLFGHGLLHLFGYDHETAEDEKEMFALQGEIIDAVVSRD